MTANCNFCKLQDNCPGLDDCVHMTTEDALHKEGGVMDCQVDKEPGKGRCCCNCVYQMLAMKHPWNQGAARGSITEILGALCTGFGEVSSEGRPKAVFFDSGHGMCEMHEFRPPLVDRSGSLEPSLEPSPMSDDIKA